MKPETEKAAANPALPSLSFYSRAHSEACAGKLQARQPAPGWPRAAAVWVPQALLLLPPGPWIGIPQAMSGSLQRLSGSLCAESSMAVLLKTLGAGCGQWQQSESETRVCH